MHLRNRLIQNNTENVSDDEMTKEEIYDEQDSVFSKGQVTNDLIIILYHGGVIFFDYTSKILKIIVNVSGIYFVWIFLHYAASQLYVKLCVPNTIVGFLMSPFMTATPHCQGLRWVIYNAANMINNMWVIFGAWICSAFLMINKEGISSPSPSPIPSVMPSS